MKSKDLKNNLFTDDKIIYEFDVKDDGKIPSDMITRKYMPVLKLALVKLGDPEKYGKRLPYGVMTFDGKKWVILGMEADMIIPYLVEEISKKDLAVFNLEFKLLKNGIKL